MFGSGTISDSIGVPTDTMTLVSCTGVEDTLVACSLAIYDPGQDDFRQERGRRIFDTAGVICFGMLRITAVILMVLCTVLVVLSYSGQGRMPRWRYQAGGWT